MATASSKALDPSPSMAVQDDQTIAGAYIYLLGRMLVIRQEQFVEREWAPSAITMVA